MPFEVEARESGRHGLGVFATAPFAEGDVVESCPVLDVPASEINGMLEGYVFASLQGDGFSTLLLGYGSLYNHSSDPNVEVHEHTGGRIAMIALRDIEAGEELVHDYGEEYWSTRDLTPRP